MGSKGGPSHCWRSAFLIRPRLSQCKYMITKPQDPKTEIPTVEAVMARYNETDPEIGYELWRIVTRHLRWPDQATESGRAPACPPKSKTEPR